MGLTPIPPATFFSKFPARTIFLAPIRMPRPPPTRGRLAVNLEKATGFNFDRLVLFFLPARTKVREIPGPFFKQRAAGLSFSPGTAEPWSDGKEKGFRAHRPSSTPPNIGRNRAQCRPHPLWTPLGPVKRKMARKGPNVGAPRSPRP